MTRNIKFSFTVKEKDFAKTMANLLVEQFNNNKLDEHAYNLKDMLEDGEYYLFLAKVKALKDELELLQMVVNDVEENVYSFINIDNENTSSVQEQQTSVVEPTQTQPTENLVEQLKQVEKLVDMVKGLKKENA
jgi:plasmid rolling circle replication initiator protein Rep